MPKMQNISPKITNKRAKNMQKCQKSPYSLKIVKIVENGKNLQKYQNHQKCQIQGVFFTGPPTKKLKFGKPRLSEVRCI